MAARDLTARVNGVYRGDYARIQQAVNTAAAMLEESLLQVQTTTDQVSAAAAQIAESAQSVAHGASAQASALVQTAASLEGMASATRQNAASASDAEKLAQSAKETSDEGTTAMMDMSGAMERILSAAEGTAAIIRDINDIAFQTNLLALNAAVEAARAGDAGRGFAVVAEEVRNLALRSKEAAKKTETLIQSSVEHARRGERVSQQVAANLNMIAMSVSQVSMLVGDISTACTTQASGIAEVNKAVADMERVTQTNAANAEEAASAVEELSGQSRELAAMVAEFHLDGADHELHRPHAA